MAELQHDRALEQSTTQTLALDAGRFHAASAVVSVRLSRNRENHAPGEILSTGLDPALCLAIDMLVASRGDAIQTHGRNLLVAFADLSTAILAARRLQWAFQGLSEADQFAGTAVAILVQTRQDLPDKPIDDSFCAPLEQAVPGQILLSEKASQFLNDSPGLATETIPGSALQQLIWRRPDAQPSIAADEQTLFRNIKGQGYGDPVPTEQTPGAWDNSPVEADAVSSEPGQPDGSSPQDTSNGLRTGLKTRRLLIFGGSSVALIGAVAFAAIALHRQSPVPPPQVMLQTPPVSPPANPPEPEPKTPVKAAAPAVKPTVSNTPRTPPAKTHDESPKENQPSGSCDSNAADAKRTLARAQKNLHDGKFDDAKRGFQSILGCEGTSAPAREGLQQVKARQEAAR